MSTFKRDNPIVAGALSNVGTPGVESRSGDAGSTPHDTSAATHTLIRTYTMTFGDRTFIVEADGATGRDSFPSRSEAQKAEREIERAANASIKK